MRLSELMRYCAIKKIDNFRVIDTFYMTDSEKILLFTSLIDDRIEKHFFDFSDKIYRGNKIQTNINYYKNWLSFAKTIEERKKYNYDINELQSLLNDMILSLLK